MKTWLHSTYKNNRDSILKEGFNILNSEEPPRFGHGVYFMNSLEYPFSKGDSILACDIDCEVLSLYHSEICEIFKEYNLQPEEEGCIELKNYVLNLGYKAVEVKYIDGTSELVVYDTDVVSNIRKYNQF